MMAGNSNQKDYNDEYLNEFLDERINSLKENPDMCIVNTNPELIRSGKMIALCMMGNDIALTAVVGKRKPKNLILAVGREAVLEQLKQGAWDGQID